MHFGDATNTSFTQDSVVPPIQGQGILDPEWAAISACVFCVVCAGLNIACIVVYQHSKGRQGWMVTEEQQRIEYRLTIYAFVTFAAQLLMAVCMLDIYVSVVIKSDFLFFASYNQMPLVNVREWRVKFYFASKYWIVAGHLHDRDPGLDGAVGQS